MSAQVSPYTPLMAAYQRTSAEEEPNSGAVSGSVGGGGKGAAHAQKEGMSSDGMLVPSPSAGVIFTNGTLNDDPAAEDSTSGIVPSSSASSPRRRITVTSVYRDDPLAHKLLLDKLTKRLLPFMALLYMASFLDRSNLGNVKKEICDDLGMSLTQYATAASIFFVPYVLGEVPSNMILERLNARRWLARISVSFGIFATLMALVHTYAQVIIVRLLLGLAEAGLFPGVVFYLTRWFTPQERAQRLAWIFAAQPISGLLGGLLAYPILSKMDGLLGLAGWRWLFFLEGFPTILLGITAWNILPADPSEASWLSSEEQRFLTERMRGVGAHGEILEVAETDEADNSNNNDDTSMVAYSPSSRAAAVPSHGIVRRDSSSTNSSTGLINGQTSEGALSVDVDAADGDGEAAQEQQLQQRQSSPSSSSAVLLPTFSVVSPSSWRARLERSWCAARAEALSLWQSTFSNRVIYLCILSNFLILIPVQAITFFLPAIVSELGVGTLAANGISAIPYSAAVVAMALVSLHSDRTQERVWHVIGCNVLGFISMGVTASLLGGSSLAASAKGALIFLQLLFLSLTAAGVWACKPALMALFTSVLRGNHAVAIAAITTAGNISGLITPPIMAALRSGSEDYSSGCFFLMTVLFAASIMVLALQREIKRSERLAALQLQQNSMGTLDSSLTASAAAAALDGSGVDEEEGILEQQHNPDYGATNFASAAVAATGSSDSTTDEDVSSGRGRAVLRNPAATASSRGQARV